MKKVLIIEDELGIAELEKDYLEASNYEVAIETDGKAGFFRAQTETFDCLILDVMLPGMTGLEICRALRLEQDLPILLVTAKGEDLDKLRGLGLGADDYIVKPFSPAELVARVKAHIQIHERLLARQTPKAENCITRHALRLYPASRRVYVGERELSLTNKEYELLYFLASNPNIVFSKATLFDRIWGMDALGDVATVTVHINRLREKLEDSSSHPRYIETVWGAGYRFATEHK